MTDAKKRGAAAGRDATGVKPDGSAPPDPASPAGAGEESGPGSCCRVDLRALRRLLAEGLRPGGG